MKLLFITPTGAIGGAERVLLAALQAVRRARPEFECRLLSLSPGPLLNKAAELGVNVEVLPAPSALHAFGDSGLAANGGGRIRNLFRAAARSIPLLHGLRRFVHELRHKVEAIEPDVVHSNGIKTHLLLWLIGLRDVPIVWHLHDFPGRRPLARRLLGFAACRAAGAIAVSQAVADDVRRLWPSLRTDVIANGVDTQVYSPGPADAGLLDQLAALPFKACLRVGMVATYARWKGQDVFLAAARIVRARPDLAVRFYLVGGPIYQTPGSQWRRSDLERQSRLLGIAEQVGFIDFQPEVAPIFRALDVVVHASTAPEPFGLTIVEAMACGKAVIVADAGGPREIVCPGQDALATPPGDAEALAHAMCKFLDDASLRERMGRNGRLRVCAQFGQERFGRQMIAYFDRILVSKAVKERFVSGPMLHTEQS